MGRVPPMLSKTKLALELVRRSKAEPRLFDLPFVIGGIKTGCEFQKKV
jgi:hypothetical protein